MSDDETTPEMLIRLGTDAMLWAQEFNKTAVKLGYSEMDEGWLIGWFANAIENSDVIRCNQLRAERDALLARLAPVDDKELVEIAADAISTYVPDQVSRWGSIKDAAIDAIAAIRPHIEAAERERCAKIADKYEGEWHSDTADACARAIAAAIRSGK